jgi:hypothetical protein
VEAALAAAGAAFVTGRLTYCDASSKLFATPAYDHTVAKVDVALATIAACVDREHVAAVLALAGQFARAATTTFGASGTTCSASTAVAAAAASGSSISTSISLVPLSASTPMRARTASQSLQAPSIQLSKVTRAGGAVAAAGPASPQVPKASVAPSTLDGWIGYVTASTMGASAHGDATVVPFADSTSATETTLDVKAAASASGDLAVGTAARLMCSFASFQLQLVAANRPLVHVAINNLSANVVIGTDSTVAANATLTDVCLRDLTAGQGSPYSAIVRTTGGQQHLARIAVSRSAAGFTSVEANMAQLRIVVLNKFVQQLLDFAGSLQTPLDQLQGSMSAVLAAPPKVQHKLFADFVDNYWLRPAGDVDGGNGGGRAGLPANFLFKLIIDAPLVILPVSSNSRDFFAADLGCLELDNHEHSEAELVGSTATAVPTARTAPCESSPVIRACLENVIVSRGTVNDGTAGGDFSAIRTILSMPMARASILLGAPATLSEALTAAPEVTLDLQIDELSAAVKASDLTLVMAAMRDNLTELPDKTLPSISPVADASSELPGFGKRGSGNIAVPVGLFLDEPPSVSFRVKIECNTLAAEFVLGKHADPTPAASLCRAVLERAVVTLQSAPLALTAMTVGLAVCEVSLRDLRPLPPLSQVTGAVPDAFRGVFRSDRAPGQDMLRANVCRNSESLRVIAPHCTSVAVIQSRFAEFGVLRHVFVQPDSPKHHRVVLLSFADPSSCAAAIAYFYTAASPDERTAFGVVDMAPPSAVACEIDVRPAECLLAPDFVIDLLAYLDAVDWSGGIPSATLPTAFPPVAFDATRSLEDTVYHDVGDDADDDADDAGDADRAELMEGVDPDDDEAIVSSTDERTAAMMVAAQEASVKHEKLATAAATRRDSKLSTMNMQLPLTCLLTHEVVDVLAMAFLDVSLLLQRVRLVMLSDLSDANSRALVAEVDGNVDYKAMGDTVQADANVTRLKVVSCTMAQRELGMIVVPPCTLAVT